MNTIDTIGEEACKLFQQRDQLERDLRSIDNQLRGLRKQYMEAGRIWGITPERFRQEVSA